MGRFARSSLRYQSVRDPRSALRKRLRDLATSRVQFGYRRLHTLLRRDGWVLSKKLVYRLYCEEGLGIWRRKSRRRKSLQVRDTRPAITRINETWSMNFVSDRLFTGGRESLAIEIGQRLTGGDVVKVLQRLSGERGKSQSIRVDNGPDFISTRLDLWAYFNGVKLDFCRPGKTHGQCVN